MLKYFILGVVSCVGLSVPLAEQFTSSVVHSEVQRHAYFDATAKWDTPSVYVCWENPEDRFISDMQAVKKSIEETWQAVSTVRFTGWKKCAPVNAGVHIQILDDGPLTRYLGNRLNGVPNGMVLNFTFANWNPGTPNCKTLHDFCMHAIAVHEFGHVLGFAHEQNRPDAPGECAELHSGPNGTTTLLTPYDPDSVMNYCNPLYNAGGKLSPTDVDAVQKIYGSPAGS